MPSVELVGTYLELTLTIKDMMMKIKTLVLLTALLSLNTIADEIASKEPTSANQASITKIALNNADAAQLSTLKGIGTKKAQAIILYREQIGQFSSLDDLLNVKGIGKKILLDNQSRLIL
ncbi:helix-hairpin-helix domain-containing protein [Thalassotalea sp. 1_MG-2023]|uniref:ComEA family DNA-binding protein n=1 Tax=Thalassotalea sp. 1_MG-2023 TaxID=3062680 RepID=UPI0026E16D59|nr:helix-hairpin-helix domain-containing protein [Thalassotalea sp. 1_MG-2023]MDO6428237.1 helix-hairpin-helix domain-containing protein [Thalassotalea sp. 1_MG-2023]